MITLKALLKKLIRCFGYNAERIEGSFRIYKPGITSLGVTPDNDIQSLIGHKKNPIIIDAGANVGQTVEEFKNIYPSAIIHSFEPGPESFKNLQANTARWDDVFPNQAGLGDKAETKKFFQHEYSEMSSFLEGNENFGSGKAINSIEAPIITLDDYTEEHGINFIDLIKTDTQGYDLQVLKGAKRLFQEKRVRLVFTEVIFVNMYEGHSSFEELYAYLTKHGFKLISMYDFRMYKQTYASWTDALFIQPEVPA
ncbi:MAG TPA: hypothetical protein DIU37_04245 [Opitutae bacterium]|nr:hypothetical protein [Opitutae bacterium]|tara:strand:- start:489 stop:1247 length:759 start_codon:yes stop_codon:yes gene_type:complete